MLPHIIAMTATTLTTGDSTSFADTFWNTIFPGALGGLFLALGRFAITYMRLKSPHPKIGQLLLMQIPLVIVLPILGGGLAWVTTGISGAFLTGLGALGFILLAAGDHGHTARQEEGDASSNG